MGFWHALTTAWEVARESERAVAAAQAALPGGPLKALQAFAAATDGQLDDEAAATLEAGLRRALELSRDAASALAWVAAHEPEARRALDALVGAAVNAGYQAGHLHATLTEWLA